MDNDKIKQIVAAVGGDAEVTAIYYTQLVKNGVPKDSAVILTTAYINGLLNSSKGDK